MVEQFFCDLLSRIQKEFTKGIEIDNITLVNCVLFENGLCQQISTENITLSKKKIFLYKAMGTSSFVCSIFFGYRHLLLFRSL